MRMVREFPNMAVSIMQELAHRVESTNNQLRAALAEVKQLRETGRYCCVMPVSRLDSFIRRLEAQRACLELAADLVGEMDGEVLELGLGNGRTYDHLRKLFPNRKIYVCERNVAAHPDCIPPPEFLLLGDMRETLPAVRSRLAERWCSLISMPGTARSRRARRWPASLPR